MQTKNQIKHHCFIEDCNRHIFVTICFNQTLFFAKYFPKTYFYVKTLLDVLKTFVGGKFIASVRFYNLLQRQLETTKH